MKKRAKEKLFLWLGLCAFFVTVIVPTALVVSPFVLSAASQSERLTRIFPGLCPASFALPEGVRPFDCLTAHLPGGLGLEMSAQMTRDQFDDSVAMLQETQYRRFNEMPCSVRGGGTTLYAEIYSAAFLRVEWSDGLMRYSANDLSPWSC